MKALLCLSLFLALSSTFAYSPSWDPISYEAGSLEITDVYSQYNPKAGQENYLTICGTAFDPLEVTGYYYQIGKVNQHPWTSGSVSMSLHTRVPVGKNYCHLFNYYVPQQAQGAYVVEFTLTSFGNLGGARIYFDI